VLVLSGLLLLLVGLLIISDVGSDCSNFSFSLSQCFSGGFNQIGESIDLSAVVVDFSFQIINKLGEGSGVGLVHFISLLLVVGQLGGDVVQEDLDFSNWASGLQMELQH
jgi:hypothetical protein